MLSNPLKTKLRLLYFRPSSYRAVNTFQLGCKNQSVNGINGTSRCLFSDKYKTHNYSVGRAYSCWIVNLLVHHVTSRLYKVQYHAINMYGTKVLVLWRMTSRGVAYIYQRLGRTSTGFTLKMVTAQSFESLVPIYQSAQRASENPNLPPLR